jgi:hypothetical protein
MPPRGGRGRGGGTKRTAAASGANIEKEQPTTKRGKKTQPKTGTNKTTPAGAVSLIEIMDDNEPATGFPVDAEAENESDSLSEPPPTDDEDDDVDSAFYPTGFQTSPPVKQPPPVTPKVPTKSKTTKATPVSSRPHKQIRDSSSDISSFRSAPTSAIGMGITMPEGSVIYYIHPSMPGDIQDAMVRSPVNT